MGRLARVTVIVKCHYFIFISCKCPFKFIYVINASFLVPLCKYVTDLGFVFSPMLSHYLHVDQVCSRALKSLGFVKRVCSKFMLKCQLNAFYSSLMRSNFIIWFCNLELSKIKIIVMLVRTC